MLGYSHVHRHRSNPHDQAAARRGRRLGPQDGADLLWESDAAARAWYTPEWETRMAAAFGAKPTVTYYDNHVIVDNEAGKVRIEE